MTATPAGSSPAGGSPAGNSPADNSTVIAAPDDWHVHLRDDDLLATVAPITARSFRYALVMPNLVPPVCTTDAAAAYRQRILDRVGPEARADFTPIMALYLNDDLDLVDFERGVDEGVVHAAKYYPAGATTNSEGGGESLDDYRPILERMAERGIPLLVHAESTDPQIDIFDRERHFLDVQLAPVLAAVPGLRVTVEHISTRAGVELVRAHGDLRGSITPHHLRCDRSDLLANGLRPDLYCKPIINSPDDREALVAAATSGSEQFFLGTDSAPHPASDKYAPRAKPGIFNAPFAIPVIAEVFHSVGALDRLEGFTSLHGCRFYGFAPSESRIRLTRVEPDDHSQAGEPPATITTAEGRVVTIFGVAEANRWQVQPMVVEPL